MKKQQQPPMNTSEQFCPNETCFARGQTGQGNIRIHDRRRERYRCRRCGHTFNARRGTMLEGLRKPTELIVIVVALLAYGCPVQAIVHAFGLDERTVARWRDRAGTHCQQVHQAVVEQGNLDLVHVQADEIRVKGRSMIAWMGLTMMVSTRLWLGGVVSLTRDTALADRMMQQVRVCSQAACAVFLHRWMGCLPQQHQESVSRKSERDSRTWTGVSARVVTVAHWNGDQTHGKVTGDRSDASDVTWVLGTGGVFDAAVTRGNSPQYGVH